MTRHSPNKRPAKGVPPPYVLDVEPFKDFAAQALADLYLTTLDDDGLRVCGFPDCGLSFVPKMTGHEYCGRACKDRDTAERRKIGLVLASAALAHQSHKYAKPGAVGHPVSTVARRYIGKVQSTWLADRRARFIAAIERGA